MNLHELFDLRTLILTLATASLVACGGAETDPGESTEDALTVRTVNYTPDYEGAFGEPLIVEGGGLGVAAATFECAGGTGVCNTTTFGQACTNNGGTLGTATCTNGSGLCDTCACGDNSGCNTSVGNVAGASEQRK